MPLVVTPRTITNAPGQFTFASQFTIGSIHAGDRLPARQLIDELATLGSVGRFSSETGDAEVLLRRSRSIGNPEGYRLEIQPDRIILSAPSAAGSFYGIQTLRELVREHGSTIPSALIVDEPDFARRGFYLDCSRGKVPTVETLFALIDYLAHWKINEFQLYVENVFQFSKHPLIGEGYSPFSASDMLAIQSHCEQNHISFVPSLTSLGHFEKILMLPEYNDLGELPGYNDLPGGTTLNPVDPRSVELVKDLYDEYLPLFASPEFNACGDEPWELGRGRSAEKAKEVGEGRVYLDFILQLRKLSVSHGKRMNIWGDIVLKYPEIIPELPKELVVLNWDYVPDGRMLVRTNEFAEAGLPFVCCPGTNGWQSHGTRLRMSMRNIHQFVGIALEHGAEGVLNTDWGDIGHRNPLGVSLHGIAYAAAASWNHQATPGPTTDEFTRNFVAQTFGDKAGALVPWLATIGDDDFGQWAYHSLLESLATPTGFGRDFSRVRTLINEVEHSDEDLQEKIEAATGLASAGFPSLQAQGRALATQSGGADPFLTKTLEEYELANQMNIESTRRVLLARSIRGGGQPESAELTRHRDALARLKSELERTWMARNRRSRLDDSLVGFDQALQEIKTLL